MGGKVKADQQPALLDLELEMVAATHAPSANPMKM
jgi:hypothetical protein